MGENHPVFLCDAAERLRRLAYVAPDIADELRRFADELERYAFGAGMKESDAD